MGAFMQRAMHKVNRYRRDLDIEDWDKAYFRSVYTWGGHVARMEQYEENRPTLEAMRLWDYSYLRQQEAVLGRGRQGHCRKLRPWRWESALGRS
eukprot:9678248-Lingulodinium_polyedra.AAC.1